MNARRPSFGMTLVLVSTALATLSCNAPDVTLFALDYVTSVQQALASSRILQENPERAAQLAEADKELLRYPTDDIEWVCHDVDGEVSAIRQNMHGTDTMDLKRADFLLFLNYSSDYESLSLAYRYDFSMDMEVLDGVTGEFVAMDTSNWSGEALQSSIPLNYDGSFSGRFDVNERRETNYPRSIVSEVSETHNYFGLVASPDFENLYFCDLGQIPIPPVAQKLTPDNFRSSCPLYYYECKSR